jgi:coenzyme Q-binding protein COQ10
MPQHRESRVLPYTPEQMFDLVADVERYPEFLPWCVACRIKTRSSPTEFNADLAVGFKMVREQFSSRITLKPKTHITVEYVKGPFQHLTNTWEFLPEGEGTRIEFFLEFEFRSRMLQAIIGVLFEEAVRRMVAAFEARARHIYGTR